MSGLTREQIETFHTEGYLHVKDALRPEDLDPVQEELERIVDDAAKRLFAEGKIDSDYAELPFEKRLIPLAKVDGSVAFAMNFPSNLGRAIFEFLHNDRLLDLVEALIGPEIYCNPCQHIRPKLPTADDYEGALSSSEWAHRTPLHQDAGVLLSEADDTLVVTTWIPLVDTNETNGTLMVYPRCHNEPLRTHIHPAGIGNWEIAEDEKPAGEPVKAPVKRGDLLMMHCRTPHGSQPNRADTLRWSMDLRWNDARKPNGRPHLPGMLVRSQETPELAITDHAEWLTAWKLAKVSSRGARWYRWPGGVPA